MTGTSGERVFERDGGRCVECGTDFEIQYDHVIPVALGGSSTEENLQLLCALQAGEGRGPVIPRLVRRRPGRCGGRPGERRRSRR
ncbi:HNH endonuclease [Saccharopolyspora antimicrobica]|uniref:HNH endonuclease n=1 Tax=Saccharopolyspora antimicrobica TaxID=455193 RepID=UPI000B883D2D